MSHNISIKTKVDVSHPFEFSWQPHIAMNPTRPAKQTMSIKMPCQIQRLESPHWLGDGRSHAIAITPSREGLEGEIAQELEALFSAERHYNAATWRMYTRITEYRRKKYAENGKATNSSASCGESSSVSSGKKENSIGPNATRVCIDDSVEEIFTLDL